MKLLAVLLFLLATLPVLAAEQPVTRDFHDWHASCSSIASACAGWTGNDASQPAVIVRRANVHQTDWELGLHLPGLGTAQTLVATVGSLQLRLQRDHDWREGAIAGDVVFTDTGESKDGSKATQLLAAMLDADSLKIVQDGPGAAPHAFSLRGIKASLLWIDESQGKKDSWRLVQAPANLGDVAPQVRQLQRHFGDDATLADIGTLPKPVRALREKASDCDPIAEITHRRGYQVQWLDANTALFSVICAPTPRAPLELHVVAHAPEFSDARVVSFPLWDESQPAMTNPLAKPPTEEVTTLILPILQPVFDRLQLVQQDNYGGFEQTWRWDGRTMQLIEVREMKLRDEKEGPWRVLWQALAVQR